MIIIGGCMNDIHISLCTAVESTHLSSHEQLFWELELPSPSSGKAWTFSSSSERSPVLARARAGRAKWVFQVAMLSRARRTGLTLVDLVCLVDQKPSGNSTICTHAIHGRGPWLQTSCLTPGRASCGSQQSQKKSTVQKFLLLLSSMSGP